jgi:hypothetical protein
VSKGPTVKRKWWIIATATLAGCIGLAFVIPALLPSQPGVTKENFDRIDIGMTRADVKAILGPGGWEGISGGRGMKERSHIFWVNERAGSDVMVWFDDEDRVELRVWHGDDDRPALLKLLNYRPWRDQPPDLKILAVE